MTSRLISNDDTQSKRADVLLAQAYPKYSRGALAKLFTQNTVTKNSKHIKPGDNIKPGETLNADISTLQQHASKIDLPIIYEDKDILVVDKPAGVISHARGKYWDEPSVASFIRDKITGLDGERAGIVHRLDRATSGVMLTAKNQQTLGFLQQQFSTRQTKKTYVAVVLGLLQPKNAIIDIPILRNPKKPQTFKADPSGKSSITQYLVKNTSGKYSLVELCPKTGRTHQLRVHLKYINHPIVGDTFYGGELADRLYLHAVSLQITTPDGREQIFNSLLPKEFMEKLDEPATK